MPNPQTESYPVKRGKFDSLTIYEVTEQELTIIERGSSNSLFLNFALPLLSVSLSFFVSIFTIDWFPEDQEGNLIAFIVFLVIAIITLLAGVICLILWFRSTDDFKATIKTIKLRLKEEKIIPPDDHESLDVTEGK